MRASSHEPAIRSGPPDTEHTVTMIDQHTKRCLGQMIKGVQVVAASHEGVTRAYTSHWVTQVSFDEPIVMASISPKHDTFPLIEASGRFTVSVLAGDQIAEGQYFSYPGRRFRYIAPEYLDENDGRPIVPNCISWFSTEVFDRVTMADHELFFARVTACGKGRLKEAPLLYSSRHGWRITGDKARERSVSVRDELLARLGENDDGSGADV
jgi:flavin reductase (DIM6/NTAB) family NADH-FMN oxidoreductase RutF